MENLNLQDYFDSQMSAAVAWLVVLTDILGLWIGYTCCNFFGSFRTSTGCSWYIHQIETIWDSFDAGLSSLKWISLCHTVSLSLCFSVSLSLLLCLLYHQEADISDDKFHSWPCTTVPYIRHFSGILHSEPIERSIGSRCDTILETVCLYLREL